MSKKEIKYYGVHAVLSIFENRKEDIIRVYLNKKNLNTFRHLLKWCSENKKAYHIVEDEDLENLTESVHHEGIVVLAKDRTFSKDWMQKIEKLPKVCILYLDGVQNPHNVGSIIRSCAHFGVTYILGEEGKLPHLSPSAVRVAKGGAEWVQLVALKDPIKTLSELKNKGFQMIGTSSHKGKSIFNMKFPNKTILCMGNESRGMSQEFIKLLNATIQIPGTGHVESLNVSIATSLCMGEFFRQSCILPT